MFNEGGKPRGLSDEEPLVLADVKRDEFRVFLKARRPELVTYVDNMFASPNLFTKVSN